ncbi:hypothetical protein [Cohnella hashimotonis]|uniref:YtkA-like domain-containing protein n=1 Tax=Cohnella hashimotonis TaxID=2826895 RepID=A0ABT6TQD4_9BACL|nr:hypothetical protein [Cohnella hashimotonis]MDI4649053.1 hypothetical protein [Cohnella hashimotonis]
MKHNKSTWAFCALLAVSLFFLIAAFAQSGRKTESMVAHDAAMAGMADMTGMAGMDMAGMDMAGMDMAGAAGIADMDDMDDMADMMNAMPQVDADMQDPLIDPMSLSAGHTHAGAAAESPSEKGVQAVWSWPEGEPEAGRSAKLVIRISGADGQPVRKFDVNSEKLLHLVAISTDLREFQHIHPEYQGEGAFVLPVTFQEGGNYRLFADFIPSGLNELTRSAEVSVSGGSESGSDPDGSRSSEFPAGPALLSQVAGGMEVELHFGHLMANMQTGLSVTFRDVDTGKPVSDLQPYLGSVGHIIAVDDKLQEYLHVHPVNAASTGPQALFGIAFPHSGVYKLWGQFQRDGQLLTIPFVVKVP